MQAHSINAPLYVVTRTGTDDAIIAQALAILAQRIRTGPVFASPSDIKAYLQLKTGGQEHETFTVLFLDSQNQLIADEEMFRGTLNQTSVYPREVVKRALALNAAGVVFSHNHPSGSTQPSRADELITHTLKAALHLVDVMVLDHIVVSATDTLSMAEVGLM